ARLALGARTYQRIGKPLLFILSAWSLMNGYHSGAAVKPLTFTGQLDRMAPRRLAETGRFLVEVCQDGGVAPYAEGWRIALRVRLMHAGVRRMILRSGEWDSARWGLPINQADMAGTIIEFSLLVLAGARELGFRFRPAESEALVHLWRWVGHLSGVAAPLLDELANEARGVAFAELVKLVQPGPDQDSLDLAAALRVVPREAARTRREKLLAAAVVPYHDGLTWAFNGDAIARALRIPNRAWRHAIHPTRLLVGGLETVRQTLPGGDALFARAGNRALHADITRMLEGAEPDFVPRRV
ncbi:MAG TPA: oxygenase MpaB family protein, partial [Polyangiaceae bacterium LLY-WYZ-15_(1-7)]|nr:oxygenase MpaB family protein [Polyangiaceae bacterium LLY-WYZ-15_(1-7)]